MIYRKCCPIQILCNLFFFNLRLYIFKFFYYKINTLQTLRQYFFYRTEKVFLLVHLLCNINQCCGHIIQYSLYFSLGQCMVKILLLQQRLLMHVLMIQFGNSFGIYCFFVIFPTLAEHRYNRRRQYTKHHWQSGNCYVVIADRFPEVLLLQIV